MKCLALFKSPRVVWRELSPPTGTISFNFSRQFLRWARRFFSSSLWVDLECEKKITSFILKPFRERGGRISLSKKKRVLPSPVHNLFLLPIFPLPSLDLILIEFHEIYLLPRRYVLSSK